MATLGKYEILHPLARGGMAELYLARSSGIEGFEKQVVLKKILPELAQNAEFVERFLDEARLAATLHHSNIAQVYDVGQDGGSYFFAMEYVPGEDLRALLNEVSKRNQTVPLEVAISILIGVCAGLHYAHEKVDSDGKSLGIIHRDVSPSNVVVSWDGTVKVVDFGIAKAAHRSSETETGRVRGKFAYMSPEQCRAQPLDRRSDIFSLGVVMFELTTCTRLFRGESDFDSMKAVVEDPIPRPSEKRPDYPPELEAVVMKTLARDPAERYATAEELQLALEAFARERKLAVSTVTVARYMESMFGQRVSTWRETGQDPRAAQEHATRTLPSQPSAGASSLPEPRARRWGRNIALGGALLAVLGAAGLTAMKLRSAPVAPTGGRQSVAVMGFKNLSGRGETAWLSTAAVEMLSTELAVGDALHTIPSADVSRARTELQLPESEAYDRETLRRVRANTGADLVVSGSYFALGNPGEKVRLDLRIQRTGDDQPMASLGDSGTVEELPEMLTRIGARVRRKLGVGEVSAADEGAVRASLPANPEAARLYAEGLAALRRVDGVRARSLLEQAVAAEPGHPIPHAALAETLTFLGYDAQATQEAERAFTLSGTLPREEQAVIEAQYRAASKDWEKSIALYRKLSAAAPDRVDYRLGIEEAQVRSGKLTDALATLEEQRRISSEDPRLDLQEARINQLLGDNAKSMAAAERAIARGREREAWGAVAVALGYRGWALRNTGHSDEGMASLEEALQLYQRAGDRLAVARTLINIATLRYFLGDFDGAGDYFMKALDILRQGGRGLVVVLANSAQLRIEQGRLTDGEKLGNEARAAAIEAGDRLMQADADLDLAEVAAQRGNFSAAQASCDEALGLARASSSKTSTVDAQLELARLDLLRGTLADARPRLEEALATAKEIDRGDAQASALHLLGQLAALQGDFATARARLEEALAIREKEKERVHALLSRRALAGLDLVEGKPGAAVALAANVAEWRMLKIPDEETRAGALLTRALLAERNVDEAAKVSARTVEIARTSQLPWVQIESHVAAGLVEVARGNRGVGEKVIDAAVGEAQKLGMVGLALETRLALVEVEEASAAKKRRTALATDAAAAGYPGIVARLAKIK
jgi:serine/threonine protein kinase/tetratricopeptide (TPR) repeat protein